jgi:hypothetical protein
MVLPLRLAVMLLCLASVAPAQESRDSIDTDAEPVVTDTLRTVDPVPIEVEPGGLTNVGTTPWARPRL